MKIEELKIREKDFKLEIYKNDDPNKILAEINLKSGNLKIDDEFPKDYKNYLYSITNNLIPSNNPDFWNDMIFKMFYPDDISYILIYHLEKSNNIVENTEKYSYQVSSGWANSEDCFIGYDIDRDGVTVTYYNDAEDFDDAREESLSTLISDIQQTIGKKNYTVLWVDNYIQNFFKLLNYNPF